MNFDQSRKELVDKLLALHQKLTKLVLVAKVGEKAWSSLITNTAGRSMGRLETIYAFLLELEAKEWKRMHEIWHWPNMTDDMWEYYFSFFSRPTLVEHIQLDFAGRALKARWLLFKEEYVAKHGTKTTPKVEHSGDSNVPKQ